MGIQDHIAAVTVSLNAKVFLTRRESGVGGSTIVFHATETLPKGFVRRAEVALAEKGCKASCKVRMHSVRRLSRCKSLESIASSFGSGEILFDPTRLAGRTSELVKLAKLIRVEIPQELGCIGFESRRRTLYVILNEKKFCPTAESLQALMQNIHDVVARWRAASDPGFDLAVRIGFEAPPASRLVAVDEASIIYKKRELFARRSAKFIRAAGLSTMFGLSAASVSAADSSEPAVSQKNLTVFGKGLRSDGDEMGLLGFKATAPIGHSFGLQLDGAVGDDDYYGAAVNLFWRDPSVGLLGVFGGLESLDGEDELDSIKMQRYGMEGELYLDKFTLGSTAGYQDRDVKHGAFGRVDIKYYVTPDMVMKMGGEFTPDIDLGRVGAEWRPGFESLPGLSIFADGEFGSNNYDAVAIGFKYHFGAKGGTLVHRDRREDPEFHIGNIGILKNAQRKAVKERDAARKKKGYTGPG